MESQEPLKSPFLLHYAPLCSAWVVWIAAASRDGPWERWISFRSVLRTKHQKQRVKTYIFKK